MNFIARKLILLLLLIFVVSCKKEPKNVPEKTQQESSITYAKGFDIIEENGIKKLIIKRAYKGSKDISEYIIKKKKNNLNTANKHNVIKTPIDKVVVTSTTHIPMVELLNEETAIVGFPYAKYISSEKTRILIDEGKITEIGKENYLNTEILLDLQSELVFGYSVSSADK